MSKIDKNDKMSFKDIAKQNYTDSFDSDFKSSDDIFTDSHRTKDFSLILSIIITIICIAFSALYYKNLFSPIPNAKISYSSSQSDASIISSKNELNLNTSSKQSTQKSEKSEIININTADLEALKTLKYIGDVRAMNIISYRETYGDFSSIEEIKNVKGIGDGIFNYIKDYICV